MIQATEGNKCCIAVVYILCFMSRKVYPSLLHQMVLEDNIAAQLSSLSVTVHYLTSQETFFTSKNKFVAC